MANVDNGNTLYIDTAGDIVSEKNVKISYIFITSTAGSQGSAIIQDVTTQATKLDLRVEANSSSQFYDLKGKPMSFPNGLRVSSITDCVLTVGIIRQGG